MSPKSLPARCVVDTNVAKTANGHYQGASPQCVARCAQALQLLMKSGHLFIDDGQRIVREYRQNLRQSGQPGPGDAFLKWVLRFEWIAGRVTRVPIRARDAGDGEDFEEIPAPPGSIRYDPSDRKFLAVAAASAEHPPIWQAMDSKWWGWREALAQAGITVHFLCPAEIAQKYEEKMRA